MARRRECASGRWWIVILTTTVMIKYSWSQSVEGDGFCTRVNAVSQTVKNWKDAPGLWQHLKLVSPSHVFNALQIGPKQVKLARMISETTWWCLLINIKRRHAGDYLTFYYFYRISFKYQDMEIKEPGSIFLGCSQVTACPQGLLTLLPIIPLLHSTLKTPRIIFPKLTLLSNQARIPCPNFTSCS